MSNENCGCKAVLNYGGFLVITETQARGIFREAVEKHWFHWLISRPVKEA